MNKHISLLLLIISSYLFFTPLAKGQLLWEISGKGLKESSYLFGTLENKDKRILQVNDSVFAKIEQCDAFAIELESTDENAKIIEKAFLLEKGKKLADFFSEKDFNFLSTFFKNELKLNIDFFEEFHPLAVGITLIYIKSKNDANFSIEEYLTQFAKSKQKKIKSIESIETQINLFKEYAPHHLLEYAQNWEKYVELIEEMIQFYEKEKLNELTKLIISDSLFMALQDKNLQERNITMTDSIDLIINRQSTFIAIGTAHLPLNFGVIKLLQKKGYSVKPVLAPKSLHLPKFQSLENEDFTKWEFVTLKKFDCSFKMPKKPEFNIEEEEGVKIYSASLESEETKNSSYLLQVIDYPKYLIHSDSMNKQEIRDYYTDMLLTIAEDVGENNVKPQKINFGKHEGLYIDAKMFGSIVKVRYAVLLVKNRQFILSVITDKNIKQNQGVDFFMNSFKIDKD